MEFNRASWLARKQLGKPSWEAHYIDYIEQVVEWLEQRGWFVNFSWKNWSGCTYETERVVQVSAKASFLMQLITLLHECGHVLISNNKRFLAGYWAPEKPGLRRKVTILDEELEAWHRGEKLGQRLGFDIDEKKLHRYKSQCIKHYAKWLLSEHHKMHIDIIG